MLRTKIRRLLLGKILITLPPLLLIAGLLLGYADFSYAKKGPPRKFPHGCRELGYEFKGPLLVLKPVSEETSQTLYLLHNSSHNKLVLELVHLPEQPFIPNFANEVHGDQWAALAMDRQIMQFRCQKMLGGGRTQSVSCENTVEACQYTRAKFASNNRGNYWVENSNSKIGVVRTAITKGILLRW